MPRQDQGGEAMWAGSVAFAAPGAVPDQAEALTFLVGEEVAALSGFERLQSCRARSWPLLS